MRLLLQRVSSAQVSVAGDVIAQIEQGLLVFVCAMIGDTEGVAQKMARKTARLRVFNDEQGKMNLSLAQIGGEALVVSQFTLYGDTSKGRRPTWMAAAPPDRAEPLVNRVVAGLRERGLEVATGRFRADMVVDLVDAKAFPARDVYKAVQEFRNPRHDEFKGGSLWTLYNGITEHLKGGDLTKLPQRTMTVQSVFDKIAGHAPEIVDAQEIALPA